MLNHLFTQFLRSFGIFFRTIRAFFTRQLVGLGARIRRMTNFSRQATKVASASLQSAVAAVKKPTKREDYVETKRLFLSKAFLLRVALGLIALGLLLYFVVWPYVLSHFLTARFYVEDDRISGWTGRVIVYADEEKTLPLYEGRLEEGVLQGKGKEYDEEGRLAYEGTFQDGLRQGQGKAYEEGLLVYEGPFVQGLYEGKGKLYQEGELYYEGDFAAGVAAGTGTRYHANGEPAYKGEFADGEPEGTGKAYDEEGRMIYQGGFAQGQYSGEGSLYPEEDQRIDAQFDQGEPTGSIQWYKDGFLYYEGESQGIVPQGFGTLYDRKGNPLYQGQFSGGTLDGQWLLSLTTEELRSAFGEGTTADYENPAGGFTVVSDQLGAAALCSFQGEAESQVYGFYLFTPKDPASWCDLLPGKDGVAEMTWPAGTATQRGTVSFQAPAGVNVASGDHQGLTATLESCQVQLLYGGQEEEPVLLSWRRLESMPAEGLSAGGGTSEQDAQMEAFLEALDAMASGSGAATQSTNPYYGGQPVASALQSCTSAQQGVELADALLQYWQAAEQRAAAEENLARTQQLLEQAQAQASRGQDGGQAEELQQQANQQQAQINEAMAQMEKASLAAKTAGVDPADFELQELAFAQDPSQWDVSTLGLTAVAYAQATQGSEVDTEAIELEVKNTLVDLAGAYLEVGTCRSAYEQAAAAAQQTAGQYAMGQATQAQWYAALSAQADARSALYGALAACGRQANTLNGLTGGWVTRTCGWNAEAFGALFG